MGCTETKVTTSWEVVFVTNKPDVGLVPNAQTKLWQSDEALGVPETKCPKDTSQVAN